MDARWTNLAEKAKQNRTVFAQRRLKPEEVLPEWQRMQRALGSQKEVRRFVARSMARLDAALDQLPRGSRAPLGALPELLRERLAADALSGTIRIDFEQPPAPGARFIHRSHPLVAALPTTFLSERWTTVRTVARLLGSAARLCGARLQWGSRRPCCSCGSVTSLRGRGRI